MRDLSHVVSSPCACAHSIRHASPCRCLDCVPPCVTLCVGLTYLSLSCNSLEVLPPAIGELLVGAFIGECGRKSLPLSGHSFTYNEGHYCLDLQSIRGHVSCADAGCEQPVSICCTIVDLLLQADFRT